MLDFKALFGVEGRVAVVTGAAQGLGVHMARILSEAGAEVAIVDLNIEGANKVAKNITQTTGHKCKAYKTDLRNPDQVAELMVIIQQEFGGIDILVNNAAVVQGKLIEDITPDDWNNIMDTNVRGPFLCIQAALPALKKSGRGVVVNVSSIAAHIAVRPIVQAHYQASKGGLDAITRALAAELAPHGIRVNTLTPGNMKSPVLGPHMEAMDFWMMRTPLKRLGEMSEIEGPLLFLSSEASSYMTGTVVVVDGGFLIW